MKRAVKRKGDLDLVKEFRAGNFEGFEEIIQRYGGKAFSLASRLTKNPQDAEEVLQDAFITVFRKIKGFQGKSSFSSWFYRVTVNAALMKLRKKRQDHSVPLEDMLPQIENTNILRTSENIEADRIAFRNELSIVLDDAIQNLPDEYRPVFILRDLDGMTSKEVGEILQISIPAVKSRLHRSRLMLRKRLQKFYKEYKTGVLQGKPPSVGNL